MEYFNAFQNWLYHTGFYQDILSKMPAPLNNIYFDSVLAIGLIVYLILRIIETIRISCYRRRIRKLQAGERERRREKEDEVSERERQVQEQEEKIGRFVDFMEILFASRARRTDQWSSDAANDERWDGKGAETWEIGGDKHRRKRIGFKRFFLEKKDDPEYESEIVIDSRSEVSDFDAAMDAYDYDEKREHEAVERREKADERMKSNLRSLDKKLIVEARQEQAYESPDKPDPEYERRKEQAKLQEEKERKHAEKLADRQRKKGERHGRFRKDG